MTPQEEQDLREQLTNTINLLISTCNGQQQMDILWQTMDKVSRMYGFAMVNQYEVQRLQRDWYQLQQSVSNAYSASSKASYNIRPHWSVY